MTNNFHYEPLTPRFINTEDEKYKVYQDALNQAYEQDEIKNIAITGIYGSGKSSVWKTYRNEKLNSRKPFWKKSGWEKDSVITVALSEFKSEAKEKQKTNIQKVAYKQKINNVEEQIINQILYQINPSKIPISKYEVKRPADLKSKLSFIVKSISIIFGVFLVLRRNDVLSLLPNNWSSWSNLVITLLTVIMIAFPVLSSAKNLIDKYKLHFTKISFQGNSVDLQENQKDILNDEMRELVYIITASDVRTIVFEDLDRFDNIDLFAKLRELNYLVNENSKHIIRFVYLLRDDLFLQHERTKFFDLIIPIVPVINSINSRGKMLKLFETEGLNDKLMPDVRVLESISLYIDDMRLLYSIRNEFEVYSKTIDLEKRKLDPNKLLGIIVFKNVFPQEFDQFQKGRGYVFQLMQNLENNRQKRIEDLQIKLDNLKSKINELTVLTANTKFELMALEIPSGINLRDNSITTPWAELLKKWSENPEYTYYLSFDGSDRTYYSYNYSKFYTEFFSDEKFQSKLRLFTDAEKQASLKQYKNEIEEIKEELNKIYVIPISDILSRMSTDELNNFFILEKTEQTQEQVLEQKYQIDLSLPYDHYFDLIRFLFYEGLLDETYTDYLGYFYESSIGLNDEIFIRKLRDGTASDELFKLNHPDIVKDKLTDKDYKKSGIYNQDLITAILNDKNDTSHFVEIVKVTLKNKSKIESLLSFLNSLNDDKINQAVRSLLIENHELYWKLLLKAESNEMLHDKLLIKAFENIVLIKDDKKQLKQLQDYIEPRADLLGHADLVVKSTILCKSL